MEQSRIQAAVAEMTVTMENIHIRIEVPTFT
jgi:hypothetical protein